jgi:hypothetical protein
MKKEKDIQNDNLIKNNNILIDLVNNMQTKLDSIEKIQIQIEKGNEVKKQQSYQIMQLNKQYND